MKLQVGTGASGADKASDAGREATTMALAALGCATPELLVVFTTPRYDLTALLAAIRDVAGGARLIGATGSGEIVQGQYMGFGAGVAVLAIAGGRYRFGIASASHIEGVLDHAGQDIARRSRAEAGPSPHAAVLLLADALLGDLQQLIRGIYRVTGPKVAIVGGAAADEQKFIATFVFHDGKVIEKGAVALWIASEHPLQVVTRHGWHPIGLPQWVTRVDGATLVELGGRPAIASRPTPPSTALIWAYSPARFCPATNPQTMRARCPGGRTDSRSLARSSICARLGMHTRAGPLGLSR